VIAVTFRLVGPGGAGKSTIGALLAERLGLRFLDLDRTVEGRVGNISEYIGRHGYDMYARANVETYCSTCCGHDRPGVVADVHPEYARVRHDLEHDSHTFVLLPSLDREICVTETVRRQIARPFGRSSPAEEVVIRSRFDIYAALPLLKIETMRPVAAVVDEIVAALALDTA
jgi:shikimate kinase